MIEMRVGHEDEIDFRQMMDFEPRLLQTLDHFQPLRPDRVDQQIELVRLNEKRRVPDPGDADFALADFGKLRLRAIAGAFGKERRDQDLGEKVALMPVSLWTQLDAGGTFIFGTVLRGLANDIPPAFFRKRNRHGGASI